MQDLKMGVSSTEEETQSVLKVYSKEDYSVVNRFESMMLMSILAERKKRQHLVQFLYKKILFFVILRSWRWLGVFRTFSGSYSFLC